MRPRAFVATALVTALLLVLPSPVLPDGPGRTEGAGAAVTPPEIVSAIDGRPIDLEGYRGLFLQARALEPPGESADRRLLEEEAKRLGVSIPYETVESEARREEEAAAALLGGKAGYQGFLRWLGVSAREESERMRSRMLERLILDACIRRTRVVTEEEARRRFRVVAPARGWGSRPFEEMKEEVARELRECPPLPRERTAYLEELRRARAARESRGSDGPPAAGGKPAASPPAALAAAADAGKGPSPPPGKAGQGGPKAEAPPAR